MNNPPENWPNNLSENSTENPNEITLISKSKIKRDAEALKKLGSTLIELGKNALNRIPLDEDLRIAIELAQKIKKEGYRRQLQLIGKMLRTRDIEPIQAALGTLQHYHNEQVMSLHKLEMLRDRLIKEGDSAISTILERYPHASRQQLRTLVRLAQKEQSANAPSKAFRQIFQYLRELAERNS